jgi:phospholipid-binding lipoprotein MlaA
MLLGPTSAPVWRRGAALAAIACLAGCAAAPGDEEAGPNDPWESSNRVVFGVNLKADKYFLKPVAEGYHDAAPGFLRDGITKIILNLGSPAILMNDLLQGHPSCAGRTLARVALNTTLGLGGFIDVGKAAGIPRHDADFGQTLGGWGVEPGPYLYSPLLGSLNPRDLAGYVVDTLADPFNLEFYLARVPTANYARFGATTIDWRERNLETIDQLRETSLDFYAVVRSLAQQRRAAAVERARAADGDEACPPS